MNVFEMQETVIYTIAVTDEEMAELRDELRMPGASDAKVVEEAVAHGLIDLLDVDNYVTDTVMIGKV